jgi:2-keto-4-pentenoate hydratase
MGRFAASVGPWRAHPDGSRRPAVRAILEAAGEQLRAGDRIITGSIVHVPIAPGDHVAVALNGDDAVSLEIA